MKIIVYLWNCFWIPFLFLARAAGYGVEKNSDSTDYARGDCSREFSDRLHSEGRSGTDVRADEIRDETRTPGEKEAGEEVSLSPEEIVATEEIIAEKLVEAPSGVPRGTLYPERNVWSDYEVADFDPLFDADDLTFEPVPMERSIEGLQFGKIYEFIPSMERSIEVRLEIPFADGKKAVLQRIERISEDRFFAEYKVEEGENLPEKFPEGQEAHST